MNCAAPHLFRTEPIIDAQTRSVTALELLYAAPSALDFANADRMLEVDVAAIATASEQLRANEGLRIHCNVEYSSLVLAMWHILPYVGPGLVLELVERHDVFHRRDIYQRLALAVLAVRQQGGAIALDDVTLTALEGTLIKILRPEIIKVDTLEALTGVRAAYPDIPVVMERIEDDDQAAVAVVGGAREIQGFWTRTLEGAAQFWDAEPHLVETDWRAPRGASYREKEAR